jgi:cytochrome b561
MGKPEMQRYSLFARSLHWISAILVLGVYIGGGEFVHAPAAGRTVERARLSSPFFLLGFAGAGRPSV